MEQKAVPPDPGEMDSHESLQLLLPESLTSIKDRSPRKSTTAKNLERMTALMVERVSSHDWTHKDFEDLVEPEYSAYLEYQDRPYIKGRDAYIKEYQKYVKDNPDYAIDPISVIADVNEKNGTAHVWMVLKVKGHPPNLERESVTVTSWRRRAGKWLMYKQTGIRGIQVGVD